MTEPSIGCSDAIRRLWDYLDETLAPEDQNLVEAHLAFCRRCCGELEFAKELRALLTSNAVDEIPVDVRERLERFMEEL
jgi:mycothiol system anti-sigma-R factor